MSLINVCRKCCNRKQWVVPNLREGTQKPEVCYKIVVLRAFRLDMFFLNLWRMHTKYNCLPSKNILLSAGFVNQSTHWTFYIAESMIDPGQILVSYWSDLKRNKTDWSLIGVCQLLVLVLNVSWWFQTIIIDIGHVLRVADFVT